MLLMQTTWTVESAKINAHHEEREFFQYALNSLSKVLLSTCWQIKTETPLFSRVLSGNHRKGAAKQRAIPLYCIHIWHVYAWHTCIPFCNTRLWFMHIHAHAWVFYISAIGPSTARAKQLHTSQPRLSRQQECGRCCRLRLNHIDGRPSVYTRALPIGDRSGTYACTCT